LLQHDIARIYPSFGDQLSGVIVGAILVMEILGPLCVQAGLKLAGETAPDDDVGTTTGRHLARVPGAEGSR
jgi:hypothetical protein